MSTEQTKHTPEQYLRDRFGLKDDDMFIDSDLTWDAVAGLLEDVFSDRDSWKNKVVGTSKNILEKKKRIEELEAENKRLSNDNSLLILGNAELREELTSQAQEIERLKEDHEKTLRALGEVERQERAAKDRELSELREKYQKAFDKWLQKEGQLEVNVRVLREALEKSREYIHKPDHISAGARIAQSNMLKKIDAALSQVTTPAPEEKKEP